MKRIIAILIALVLVSGGVFAALYTQTWNPAWNPFRPKPEDVISEMTEKMEKLDSVHSDFVFDVKELDKGMWLSVKTVSDVNQKDKENLKEHSKLDINLTYNEKSYPFGIETVILDKESYWKVTKLPDISELIPLVVPYYMVNLSRDQEESLQRISQLISKEVIDQWIKVDEEEIKEMMGEAYSEDSMETLQNQQKELEKRLSNVFRNHNLYKVKKEFPDTKIGNVRVYHYLLVVDREGVKELIPDVLDTIIDFSSSSIPSEEMSPKETKELLDKFDIPGLVDKFFERLGDIEYEVWIGQKDKYLYKTKFNKEIELADLKEIILQHLEEVASVMEGTIQEKQEELEKVRKALEGKFEEKVTISGEMNFSNFNKIDEIEAPEDFVPIKDFLESLSRKILFDLMMHGGFNSPMGPGIPSPGMPSYNMPSEGLPIPQY
ncbi:hypothetical protein J7K24_03390 [bacterium]|nr:hypothetical protein [bacterium]